MWRGWGRGGYCDRRTATSLPASRRAFFDSVTAPRVDHHRRRRDDSPREHVDYGIITYTLYYYRVIVSSGRPTYRYHARRVCYGAGGPSNVNIHCRLFTVGRGSARGKRSSRRARFYAYVVACSRDPKADAAAAADGFRTLEGIQISSDARDEHRTAKCDRGPDERFYGPLGNFYYYFFLFFFGGEGARKFGAAADRIVA